MNERDLRSGVITLKDFIDAEEKGCLWEGHSPFTIGEVDEDGKVIESFTVKPGEWIPQKWIKIAREAWDGIQEIDDKGKYSHDTVYKHFQRVDREKKK